MDSGSSIYIIDVRRNANFLLEQCREKPRQLGFEAKMQFFSLNLPCITGKTIAGESYGWKCSKRKFMMPVGI